MEDGGLRIYGISPGRQWLKCAAPSAETRILGQEWALPEGQLGVFCSGSSASRHPSRTWHDALTSSVRLWHCEYPDRIIGRGRARCWSMCCVCGPVDHTTRALLDDSGRLRWISAVVDRVCGSLGLSPSLPMAMTRTMQLCSTPFDFTSTYQAPCPALMSTQPIEDEGEEDIHSGTKTINVSTSGEQDKVH
jgi:hypothetical protein